jgi:SnoaL-like domain
MATIEELAGEVAALRRRVEATEGVLELQALKARYGELVDLRYSGGGVVDSTRLARLAEEVSELFTVDGEWDGGLGKAVGRPAIADRLRTPTLTFSRHLFVKPRIDLDRDRATARWDLLCPCRDSHGRSFWMCGYEDDEYVRTGGAWLYRSMKLTTLFMAPVEEGWAKILA